MKKKIVCISISVVVLLIAVWSAMVITDYTRSKNLKAPLFATSIHLNQHGAGRYKGIGYDVIAVSKAFNREEHILYDMHFMLFGRGNGGKKTLYDNYRHNLGLLVSDKEHILNSLEALQYVTPDVSGNQETYTEYLNGNDVKIMNMILYNDIVAGFEYEYHNLEAAFDFATYLRKDLELTFGEKTTYPGMAQTNKDYFDSIKSVSELKPGFTYYEDWTAVFDYNKKDNLKKMLEGKKYSRTDIRFELKVVDENKAIVSTRIIAIP